MVALMTEWSPWELRALAGAQRPWQESPLFHTWPEQEALNVTESREAGWGVRDTVTWGLIT
jgi:hypothetical protein